VTEHSESRKVPYSADLMFQVVADVEAYPKFLPWVLALRVKSRNREGARDVLAAEMLVGYGALRERYTSRVVLDREARIIDVVETEGPFKRLENHWRFAPDGEGCRVEFRIAFEFSSRLLQVTAGAAFARVMMRMTDAFEARAKEIAEEQLAAKSQKD
jgi:coenzyme Q-binding protein COQ10